MEHITVHTNNKYTLNIDSDHSTIFIKSIIQLNILTNPTVNSTQTFLSFYTSSNVCSLEDLLRKYHNNLPYEIVIQLAWYLTSQIKYLERNHYTFFYIHPKDILVLLPMNTFFIAVPNMVCPINHATIKLSTPFNKDQYAAPELLTVNRLPAIVHSCTSGYYSLGKLITELSPHNLFIYTKLYWFIERCLANDYKKRYLLL